MIHIKTETENSKDFVSAFRVCQTSQHVDWEPQTSEPFRNTYTKLGTRTSGTMPEHREGRTETRSGKPQRRTNKAQTHRVAHRNTTCTHYRDKTLSTEVEHCLSQHAHKGFGRRQSEGHNWFLLFPGLPFAHRKEICFSPKFAKQINHCQKLMHNCTCGNKCDH